MSLVRPPRAMILDGDVPVPPEPDPAWAHAAPPMVQDGPHTHHGHHGMVYTTGLVHGYSTVGPQSYGGWMTSGD